MRENTVRTKLRAGGISVGSFLSFESPLSAEIMAAAGFDWLIIDGEHGPITPSGAIHLINAIRATKAIPFVRVVWNESSLIQQALDSGAFGVMVPVINNKEDALRAVADAKYPPLGNRSNGGIRQAIAFGTDRNDYFTHANTETLLMAQVETAESIANVDAIAATEGIDILFVGPNDLAISMNEFPLNWNTSSRQYRDALASVPKAAKKHGKFAGILAGDPKFAQDCIDMGYQALAYSGDSSLLMKAAKAARAEVNG